MHLPALHRLYKKVRLRKKFWLTPAGLIVALSMALMFTTVAYAVSNKLPDPGSTGPYANLVIGRVSGGSTLTAPQTTAKLVFNNPPDAVDIFDGPYCDTSSYDHKTQSANSPCSSTAIEGEVYYDFQAYDNNTGLATGPVLRYKGSSMVVNGNFRANLSGLAGLSRSTDSKYFVLMTAYWAFINDPSCVPASPISSICQTGSNFFKMAMPQDATHANDYITFNVTNGAPSPLTVESDGPGAPEASDMTFEFAPPCDATPAILATPLKWTDADYGQSNQTANGGGIGWDLYDVPPSGPTTIIAHQQDAQLGGQGEDKTYSVPFQLGHKYRWTWTNVDKDNGVQLYFPFDGYNYVRNCGAVTINKTSTAPPNLSRGQNFNYNLTVNLAGSTLNNLSVTDTLPAEVGYVADPGNQPAPSSIAGQTLTWNFGAGSPYLNQLNTTGTLNITFKVQVLATVPTSTTQINNKATGSATDTSGNPVPTTDGSTTTPLAPPDINDRPFFVVNGGDTMVGAAMAPAGPVGAGASSCTIAPNNNASVVSWNKDPIGGDYGGSGTQYAAFAPKHIQEFTTARDSLANPKTPSGLAFANDNSILGMFAPASGLYGGMFGSNGCLPDYFSQATAATASAGPRTLTSLPGFPAGGAIGNGTQFIRYIDGDLYIDSNVVFSGATAGYGSVGQIPVFMVVVRGNIFVDKSVTQLDGLYIAQPSTADFNKGVIFTCGINGTPPFAAAPLNRNLRPDCQQPLTVNGAFVGRQLRLLRSTGDVKAYPANPAEVFNYVPDVWLSAPYSSSLSGVTGDYTSIQSLPPTL